MKPLQMLPIAALVGSIFGNPVLAADEAATETTPIKAEIKEVRVKGIHAQYPLLRRFVCRVSAVVRMEIYSLADPSAFGWSSGLTVWRNEKAV